MGGEHHRYYKHDKFRQNPRGDPKFLVDLTRNDPNMSMPTKYNDKIILPSTHIIELLSTVYKL